MEIVSYTGIYKDSNKEIPITIENDLFTLTAIVEGVRFTSSNIIDWFVDKTCEYDEEKLHELSVSTVMTKEGFNLITKYVLSNCILIFNIPQTILDKQTAKEEVKDLTITIDMAQAESSITLSFEYNNQVIEFANVQDFQGGLDKLNASIKKQYVVFNCYNCRYSSYSVYGQDVFGTLMCYKKYKERFLSITGKESYLRVQEAGYETVQETYYCDNFQLPDKEQFLYK